VKTRVFLAILSLFLFGACNQKAGFHAIEIPNETAKVNDIFSPSPEEEKESLENPELEDTDLTDNDENPVGQSLIQVGRWVIKNEARKVGPACNFFIQRVFFLMGFGRSSWLANDFDSYVKKSFTSYDQEVFHPHSPASDRNQLQKFLGSLSEGEGVVLQWKRKSGPGHVAILHRIDRQLVIYHASLNRFIPKAQVVKLDVLLPRSRGAYTLNIFSHFRK